MPSKRHFAPRAARVRVPGPGPAAPADLAAPPPPGSQADMVRSGGLRSNTRDLFQRGYREHGYINLTTYLRQYKLGDYVDIKVNPAVQAGMPHKFYHGRTGRIWNITKRALGVEVNKQVGNRIIRKRIHVRVEHVRPSRCREDFLKRREENDKARIAAKKAGKTFSTKDVKRLPQVRERGRRWLTACCRVVTWACCWPGAGCGCCWLTIGRVGGCVTVVPCLLSEPPRRLHDDERAGEDDDGDGGALRHRA